MGGGARYIMGLALLGAGFSSLLANTQRGMVLLGAGLDKDVSLESKFIRIGCLACLAFAMVVCYSYGGSPTQLIRWRTLPPRLQHLWVACSCC